MFYFKVYFIYFLFSKLKKKKRNLLKNIKRVDSYHDYSNQNDQTWYREVSFNEKNLITMVFHLYLAWKNISCSRENFFSVWFYIFIPIYRCFELKDWFVRFLRYFLDFLLQNRLKMQFYIYKYLNFIFQHYLVWSKSGMANNVSFTLIIF